MIYQKLLAGTEPYFAHLSQGYAFEMHCHPEIELSYCFEGFYDITVGKKDTTLTKGDIAVVNPMVPHEFRNSSSPDSLRLTIEIGPAFLGEQFAAFVSANRGNSVFLLNQNSSLPYHGELSAMLDETANLHLTKTPFSGLCIKGNIYKISALLLRLLTEEKPAEPAFKSMADIEKIGMAINMIYNCYNKQLTLDEVSQISGYSKSNFCKLFKSLTGESFHAMLNRHRIDVACLWLRESKNSIEEIAANVGFSDSRSFCRTFKSITGQNASEYRRNAKSR